MRKILVIGSGGAGKSALTNSLNPRRPRMRKLFAHWWQACVAGILVGVPTGIALEYARRAYSEAASVNIARQFESQGTSPPLMVDFLQPWIIPTLTPVVFVLLALLIHAVMIRRHGGPIGEN